VTIGLVYSSWNLFRFLLWPPPLSYKHIMGPQVVQIVFNHFFISTSRPVLSPPIYIYKEGPIFTSYKPSKFCFPSKRSVVIDK
jgi:hypothetical protein